MNPETRNCQNCKNDFIIESDDFAFYDKIKVPPPTFCPECRMQRRFSYRNERTLHRRKCNFSDKDIISCFSPDSPFVVIDRDLWWGDSWDPFEYGKDYDFSKSFFTQFRELMENVPIPSLFIGKCTDTKYGNHIGEFKNAYLVSASWIGENIFYSSRCNNCKDSMDMFGAFDCEFCYGNVSCSKNNRVYFSNQTSNCSESAFLFDCKNCTNCLLCSNLRNKQYCILNEQYTKDQYLEKIKEYNIGSYSFLIKAKEAFKNLFENSLHKYANIINSQNVTGDNILNTTNCKLCFDVARDVKDGAYLINAVGKLEQSYDGYGIGDNAQLLYEGVDCGVNGSNQLFVATVWDSFNVNYSYNCHGCNDIFGCVGLRKKSYCIFNKQYEKDEYLEMLEKIKQQMVDIPYTDKVGRIYKYGEYFPIELSPFAYNETVANDYFRLNKEEVENNGWLYKDNQQGQYNVTKKPDDIPDHINEIDDSICNEVLECVACKKSYKIIPDEFGYLQRFGIALPRMCFECRHRERFLSVNFPRLYTRECMNNCGTTFETTYSPDRTEKVYCEKCYQQEVM